MKNKNKSPNGVSVSSLGSLCLRRSLRSWRSLAMIAAMEKSVAQGRAEHSSSMAGPRPSPCSSIKLTASENLRPHTSPTVHPIDGTDHSLRRDKYNLLTTFVPLSYYYYLVFIKIVKINLLLIFKVENKFRIITLILHNCLNIVVKRYLI